MNNDEIGLVVVRARLKRARVCPFDDPAAALRRSRARWHRHHQAYREGEG